MHPNFSSACRTARAICARSVTSNCTASAFSSCPEASPVSRSRWRAVTTARQPWSSTSLASSLPKPVEQPVINHTGDCCCVISFSFLHSMVIVSPGCEQFHSRLDFQLSSPWQGLADEQLSGREHFVATRTIERLVHPPGPHRPLIRYSAYSLLSLQFNEHPVRQ